MGKKENKIKKTEAFKVGLAMSIIFQPFEVMRTRMVVESSKYKGLRGFYKASKDVYRNEGYKGFYKGGSV